MKDMLSHFGFRVTPFTREIPVEEHYSHEQFDEAIDALVGAVERKLPAALVAPSGTGKTCALRKLAARLPEARYRVHYVKVTSLSKRDMCREICAALGVEPAGSYPTLVRRFQEFCETLLDSGGLRPVLILDEAHDLRPDVLAMVRILTNFEMDSRLVVSFVLAGETRLRKLLQRDELECVTRRLAHVAVLQPLGKKDAQSYVKHRCNVAGSRSVPFDARAHEAIFEIARGNLRATDRLALKSLELAFRDGSKAADANHVAEARGVLWP